MKKFLPLLLVLVLLTGCGRTSVGRMDSADEPQNGLLTENTVQVPSEEIVRNNFEKAKEVYGWFDLCSMDGDSSDTFRVDQVVYRRVVNEEVPTYEALRTLVYDLFDTATGDRLLDEGNEYPPYRDVNGALYGMDGARGADITKGDYTLTVETENSTTILCKVQVESIEFDETSENYRKVVGYEDFTYHYCQIGNRWVFTDFSLWY